MNLNEFKGYVEKFRFDPKKLFDLWKTNNSVVDVLKCIRSNVKEHGYVNIFITEGKRNCGIIIESKPNSRKQVKEIDPASFGKFYFPIKAEEFPLLVETLTMEFAELEGTTDKIYPGKKYCISMNNGEVNIGYSTVNPSLVRSIVHNLVEPKN